MWTITQRSVLIDFLSFIAYLLAKLTNQCPFILRDTEDLFFEQQASKHALFQDMLNNIIGRALYL